MQRVWLATNPATEVEPLDDAERLPVILFPRESWQGYVADAPGLMDGVSNPFKAARARGPRWLANSQPAGDPPASPIPGRVADA